MVATVGLPFCAKAPRRGDTGAGPGAVRKVHTWKDARLYRACVRVCHRFGRRQWTGFSGLFRFLPPSAGLGCVNTMSTSRRKQAQQESSERCRFGVTAARRNAPQPFPHTSQAEGRGFEPRRPLSRKLRSFGLFLTRSGRTQLSLAVRFLYPREPTCSSPKAASQIMARVSSAGKRTEPVDSSSLVTKLSHGRADPPSAGGARERRFPGCRPAPNIRVRGATFQPSFSCEGPETLRAERHSRRFRSRVGPQKPFLSGDA
jgi:hypothetical protein